MLKVGQLARRTGLTVRTLHHYDEIGLLTPSARSPSGYRLYDDADVARLQRIVALRQLGFSLDHVCACLDDPAWSPARVLRLRLDALRGELEEQRRLLHKLEHVADRLDSAETVTVDEFLDTIGALTMYEKYYTPEQLTRLETRRAAVGEARIKAVQEEWPQLITAVRAEMEKGTDPSDPAVTALARRWTALVQEFTGGDRGIAQSLKTMYQNEPAARQRSGLDPALLAYVQKARAADR